MPASEWGPFSCEREALATRAAAAIRAAYDAAPGTGATFPAALKVLTDACEAAGVELGAYDLSPLRQMSYMEIAQCAALAGIIRRAFEAGKAAALEGTVTEWGVRFTLSPGDRAESPCPDEDDARASVENMNEHRPDFAAVLVKRDAARPAGEWEEVPGA